MSKAKTTVAVLAVLGTLAIGAGAWARNGEQDREDRLHGVAELKNVSLTPVARLDESRATEQLSIHFPADRAIGLLYTRPRDAKDWPGGNWERLGEAIGEVAIPAGRQVRLELGAGSRADLSPLRRLRPDDIQSLRVRNASLRGDDLVALAHLTGLEEVSLLNCPIGDEGAKHLAGLHRLKHLGIGGCQVGDDGLADLAKLQFLKHLELSRCWFTEEGLAHVGRMKSLESLDLYGSDINDGGLAHLQNSTALESLRLADCLHISDAGLSHLKRLSRLKRLDLDSAAITDAGLVLLANLESLEDLNLDQTKVTDAGLAHLHGLRALRRLMLPQGISDAGLAHVGSVRSLRELVVHAGPVTDQGIAALSRLERLETLYVGSPYPGSHVTDAAITRLAGLPRLKSLALQSTEIGDDGLESLARAESLESLALYSNRVTSEGLRHLILLPALKSLDLEGIKGDGGGLHHLRPLVGLTRLRIVGKGWLGADGVGNRTGDEGVGYLSGLTRLQSLTLDFPLTDEGVRQLAALTSLRMLTINNKNNRVTDDGLKSVSKINGLTHLLVSGWISDRGLKHLEGLRSLDRVNLGGRPGAISDEGVASLKASNPSIRLVNYPRRRKEDTPPPAVGRAAPKVEVEAFDGKKVRLDDLRGKVVMLYFWATWCSPCMADTPKLKAFIEGHRGTDGSFEAISLSLDEDAHWANRHAQRNQLNWPQAWVGVDSPVCWAYAVNSAPHYVVISPDGMVTYAGSEFDAAKDAVNGALERCIP